MPPRYFVEFGYQFENLQRAMQRLYIVVLVAGDPSVSIDLLMRSLLALGASPKEIAKAISETPRAA